MHSADRRSARNGSVKIIPNKEGGRVSIREETRGENLVLGRDRGALEESQSRCDILKSDIERLWHIKRNLAAYNAKVVPRRRKIICILEGAAAINLLVGVLTMTIIVANLGVLNRFLPSNFRDVLKNIVEKPLVIEIATILLLVAGALGVALVFSLSYLRNEETKSRDKMVFYMMEVVKDTASTEHLLLAGSAALHVGTTKGQRNLNDRVRQLESHAVECERTQRSVLAMLADCQKAVATLDEEFRGRVDGYVSKLQESVEELHAITEEINKRVELSEAGMTRMVKEVMQHTSTTSATLIGVWGDVLAQAARKTEEMKQYIGKVKEDIAEILKNNVTDTEKVVEHIMECRERNIAMISFMLHDRDSAAVAMCVMLGNMCERLEKVKDFAAARRYEGIKDKLKYDVGISFKNLLGMGYLDTEIISLYKAIIADFGEVSEILPLLSEDISDLSNLERYGETCRRVSASCYQKLLGNKGLMREKKYEDFVGKLEEFVRRDFSLEDDSVREAVVAIRECMPHFRILPYMLQITTSVMKIYDSAQDMQKVFGSVCKNFGKEYISIPDEIASSIGSSISAVKIESPSTTPAEQVHADT